MKQSRTKENQKKIIAALSSTMGHISEALKKAKVSRTTFYRWLKEDDEFKRAVDQVEIETVEFVENCMMKQIKKGNTALTIFFLKNRASHIYGEDKKQDDAKSAFQSLPLEKRLAMIKILSE